MAEWAQKVFWSEVTVGKVDDGFAVLLDGREINTPLKSKLYLPTKALAQEIASEWASIEDNIDSEKLPLTKIANAVIDKVSVESDGIIPMLAEYATTDLVCYRATKPAGLIKRQQEVWDPLIEWFANDYGVRLKVGTGVMPITQSPDVLDICSKALRGYTAFELAAIYDLITLSGSFVIGMAAADKKLSISEAWSASRVDEDWQMQEWGEDEEATELARTRQLAFERSSFVLDLL